MFIISRRVGEQDIRFEYFTRMCHAQPSSTLVLSPEIIFAIRRNDGDNGCDVKIQCKDCSIIYLIIKIILKTLRCPPTKNCVTLTKFPTVFLEQHTSHLWMEEVWDCWIHLNKHSTHPVFSLHQAKHPKQQSTAMTTGIATSTVLATEKELPEFLAGLKGGGEIVVEACGTTWFRGVPDRKRIFMYGINIYQTAQGRKTWTSLILVSRC